MPFFRDDKFSSFYHNIKWRDLHYPCCLFVSNSQAGMKPLTVSGEFLLNIQNMQDHLRQKLTSEV